MNSDANKAVIITAITATVKYDSSQEISRQRQAWGILYGSPWSFTWLDFLLNFETFVIGGNAFKKLAN